MLARFSQARAPSPITTGLEIGQISAAEATGGAGVAIQFARRSNDSLRAIGFPDGIVGPPTNKTAFGANRLDIDFANASGPQDLPPELVTIQHAARIRVSELGRPRGTATDRSASVSADECVIFESLKV